MSRHLVEQSHEYKLQRIGVKEHHEQQHEIQGRGGAIVQSVAPEEIVMLPPDLREEAKAHGEGHKAAHVGQQLAKCVRHLQRDHQQGQREAEDHVAEGLDARDLVAAPAEFSCWLWTKFCIGFADMRNFRLTVSNRSASATTGEGVSA